jgi:hypothetical protein
VFRFLSSKTRTRCGCHHTTIKGSHPIVLILALLPAARLFYWMDVWANLSAKIIMGASVATLLFVLLLFGPLHERIHWAAYYLVGVSATHLRVHYNYIQVYGKLTFRQWVIATLAPVLLAIVPLVLSWTVALPALKALFEFYAWLGLAGLSADLSWIMAAARIGSRGIYWDRGQCLHIVHRAGL